MSTTIKKFGLNFRTGRKRSLDVTSNFYGSEPSSTNSTSKNLHEGSHELDEIAIVSTSNANPNHVHYGPSYAAGPKIIPGIITSGNLSIHNDPNKVVKISTDAGNKFSSDFINTKQSKPANGPKQRISSFSNYKLDVDNETYANSLLTSNMSSYRYSPSPSTMTAIYNPSATNSEVDLLMLSSQNIRPTQINSNYSTEESIKKSSQNHKPQSDLCHLKIPSLTLTNSTGDIPLMEDNNFWRPILASTSTSATTFQHNRKQRPHNITSPQGNHNSHHLSHMHLPPNHYHQSMSNNKLNSLNHINSSNSSCNGLDRYKKSNDGSKFHGKWSFVFDPAGRLCYYWYMVISLAFLYNFWVIVYRFAFQEINKSTIAIWFCFDYLFDFLYLLDILFHFRMGYLEDGVLQTDPIKLRNHYMNSTTFYIDCLCLLPLDFLYLSIGFNSVLRSFRLVKIYRFWAFMDRTERHTNYPNLFRSISLIHYLLVVYHWNGCFYYIIYKNNGFGSRDWVYLNGDDQDIIKNYLQSYYWCTLALTSIGGLPKPRTNGEYAFVILQLLFGLFLLATVLGHVFNIVTSVSAARKEFQAKLDGVKTYMRMRHVPEHLQIKVIKWFDYLWLTQKCSDEEKSMSCLPDKLKAEIAINVHLDTLKRVEIFQNTEAGFLCELVLRLRPVLFSPGDYICRKGEVGKEMYIVNRGRLQVVADNGKTVLATLKAGSYFGEISILNMGTAGNRRTASVRSVGYSDLFVLSKKDMWDVLKEYPAARVRLEAIAVKRLEKYKKAPLQKVAMGRSNSTPGLVESKGRISLEDMWVSSVPLRFQRPSMSNSSTVSSNNQSPKIKLKENVIQTEIESKTRNEKVKNESLEAEIQILRQRLQTVEAENVAMTLKLNEQQNEIQKKLQEIELKFKETKDIDVHVTSNDTPGSSFEENERNRESFI